MTKQTDAELFESGERGRAKGQCGSVIVATDELGRNYHQCSGADKHTEPHYCGCGQQWATGGETTGPLRDVVFPS